MLGRTLAPARTRRNRLGPGHLPFLLLVTLAPVVADATPGGRPLVPYPRVMSEAGGALRLVAASRIVSERPREDAYALSMLAELARSTEGGPPASRDRGARPVRKVVLRARPAGAPPIGVVPDQSYSIRVAGDSVVVAGPTAAARLYGVQTLRQLARSGGNVLPACAVDDGPALAVRGLSLDISRGRLPTEAEFTRILDVCAAFKLNLVQLYIEDTFPFRGVPADAIRGYVLSPATLRRVSIEARRRCITLVPIVQTLGHQERMLSRASMRGFSELNAPRSVLDRILRGWLDSLFRPLARLGLCPAATVGPSGMFAPTEPAARLLVRSMVDDVLHASGAGAVHIGCDEATELGLGAGAREAARRGVAAIYLDHVRRLAGHAQARWNAAAWVYGDFFLRHPALLDSLPPNVIVVDWHYQPDHTFESLDSLRRVGPGRLVTSAGLWNWFAIFPDYAKAMPNIRMATSAAQSRGCRGSILASWGDGGSEDLFGNDVFGLAYFADRAWSPASAGTRDFVEVYCRVRFGGTAGDALPVYRALTQLSLPNVGHNQRLVYRPVIVRERTPAWKAAMLALNRRMRASRQALSRVRPGDTYAAAELRALTVTIDRLLASTERELTLDSLATDVATASAGAFARSAQHSASLRRLLELETRAAGAYGAAWRAHNEESELPVILERLGAQVSVLDSLRVRAMSGPLEVPARYRRAS